MAQQSRNLKVTHLLSGLVWLVPIILLLDACLRPLAEGDLFFYLALVNKYLAAGEWPTADPFLLVSTQPLHSLHQWLGYFAFYFSYWAGGFAGPILFKTLMVSLMFILPFLKLWPRLKTQLGGLWEAGFWSGLFTLVIFSGHHRFRERASLFGELAVELLVMGLLFARRNRIFHFLLPVGFWLWAQLHPSFLLGLVILIAFMIFNRREIPLWALIASLGAPLIHPNGVEGYNYPIRFAIETQPYLARHVFEWLPLWDERIFAFLFVYIPFLTLGPLVAWLIFRFQKQNRFAVFLLVLSVYMMASSVRFGLSGQLILLILAVYLAQDHQIFRYKKTAGALSLSLGALALFLRLQHSPYLTSSLNERLALSNEVPVAAAQTLRASQGSPRIFNSFKYGGYLAFAWGGDPPLFWHGFSTDFDFFEHNYLAPQESRAQLDRLVSEFDINAFLLTKTGSDLGYIRLLEAHPDWDLLYQDSEAVAFVRKTSKR